MKKQKLLFTALTLSIVTVGSIAMPHIIKAERTKTSTVDLQTGSMLLSADKNSNISNAVKNLSIDNYENVICYTGEDLKLHQMYCQEKVLNMAQTYSEHELEISAIYEYRGYRACFIEGKDGGCAGFMTPDASDVKPEIIVKKSIDTFLDADKIDLNNKSIVISLSKALLGTDGYTAKRYDVELYDDNTLDTHEPHGLYYYGYLSLSGEVDAFFHTDTFDSSQISENTSDLKYWPNIGEAAEDVYGQAFGKAESDEDYKIAEKYIDIVNDKIKDYGITKIKELKLGYVKESILYLFAYMEDGYFDEIDYSLKYDEIIRYKKRTYPEYSEFFLLTQLPEDLLIKAQDKIFREQWLNEEQALNEE